MGSCAAPSTKQWHQFTIARSLQQCRPAGVFLWRSSRSLFTQRGIAEWLTLTASAALTQLTSPLRA
ncbi:hypothetical protein EWM60_01880 [Candidatus Erwinia dacicola]|nr:hypothetical protein [Candidatus Erwinia dacicola]